MTGAASLDAPRPPDTADTDTMLLRGKSFKTQFHGATHVGALIAYIPELAKFTKETFQTFPSFQRIRQDMKALENRTLYAGTEPTLTKDDDLRGLLAPKAETDVLVQLYLENYDPIYHVLHTPTFRQDYNDMWQDPSSCRPHIIALVLIMTACSQLLSPSTVPWLYTGNSSTIRERAISVIRQVEDWLQTKSEKHVTILDFQIRFLLILAKRITVRKAKRQWSQASKFLQFCMSAGLHRDPANLRKHTSALDKEMRRRIWSVAREFELQMAFERGMAAAPWPSQSDCPPPENINDNDFDQSTIGRPSARPWQDFTSASWLSLSNETLMLRHSINTVLNSIRQPLTFDEGKRYTEELESHLKNIPSWIGRSSEGPRAVLESNLRQYILCIHNRLLRQPSSQTERNFSRLTLLENSTRIVDIFKKLAVNDNISLQLLREDLVRAACSVSHVSSAVDTNADASSSLMSQVLDVNANQLIADVVERLTQNIGRYGREQRQLWIVLAANGFMKTARDPANKLSYMQEAVDKITKPYYKILAGQEKAPLSVGKPDSLTKEWSSTGFIEYLPNGGDAASGAFQSAEARLVSGNTIIDDPPLLDLEELAAWTFEDWAFTPDLSGLGEEL